MAKTAAAPATPKKHNHAATPAPTPTPAPAPAVTDQEVDDFHPIECDLHELQEPFRALVLDLQQGIRKAKQEEEAAAERASSLGATLQELLDSLGVTRVVLPDDWCAEKCRGRSPSRLDRTILTHKLLELNVRATVISTAMTHATIPGKPYFFTKVRELREGEKRKADLRREATGKRLGLVPREGKR